MIAEGELTPVFRISLSPSRTATEASPIDSDAPADAGRDGHPLLPAMDEQGSSSVASPIGTPLVRPRVKLTRPCSPQYPTIQDLAAGSQEEVHALWSGLGCQSCRFKSSSRCCWLTIALPPLPFRLLRFRLLASDASATCRPEGR
jgi:hypothetical protein